MKYICLGYLESGKFEGMTDTTTISAPPEIFSPRSLFSLPRPQ